MNTDEWAVAAALRQVSTDARPARIPDDLWARGRRRRRLRLTVAAAGVAALLTLTAIPLAWAPRSVRVEPAGREPSIPSSVHAPLLLQPDLVDAPNGPASVIVTGPGGFGANDLFGYDDRAVVVGQDGTYRYVRDINAFDAGENLLLSPNGRYVAGQADLEGVVFGESASDWQSATGVMNLATGEVRTYHSGPAVAWSPDGRLLTGPSSGPLTLLNVSSADAVPLGVGGAEVVAFSPDGRQLAVQTGQTLKVLDLDTSTVRTVANLGQRQTLAGPGAWSTGGRLAVWDRTDCTPVCPAGFRLSFVDISSGAVTEADFDPVQAVSAKLIGWQTDGDAVVVLTMTSPDPAGPHLGAPQVLALRPSGGRTTLITVTADADRIDVARDLLDRFGGDSPSGAEQFLDVVRVRLSQARLPIAVIALLVAAPLIYRRVRDGVWPWPPRRFRDRRPLR